MSKQRLIDANALKEEVLFQQEHMWPEDLSYQIPKMIDKQTTIDAIPVEWLKEKMQKPQTTCMNPFGFVLAEWLEEQEVRA